MPLSHLLDSRLEQFLHSTGQNGDQTTGAPRRQWQKALVCAALVVVTAVLVFGLTAAGFPSPEALGIVFVLPVLAAAIFLDLRMALLSVVLSVAAYNLALLPQQELDLTQPGAIAKMVVLLIVTVIVSALATRLKQLGQESRAREDVLSGLYALSHGLLGLTTAAEVQAAAASKLAELTGQACRIDLTDEIAPDDLEAQACVRDAQPVMAGKTRLMPLIAGASQRQTVLGVLRLTPHAEPGRAPLPLAPKVLAPKVLAPKVLATLTAQTAITLHKAQLSQAHEGKVRQADRERFMSALLSSVSHDFKTPLVTIIGAFSALTTTASLSPAHSDLATGGLEEARRLDRFVTNLIEISRLEAGLMDMGHEPVLLRDAVASALRALRPLVRGQTFRIDIDSRFPLLKLNPALMELVLLNLLENAVKHGPPEGVITITGAVADDGVVIDVDDDGEGIAPELRQRVFQKFFRADAGDRKVAGTGLGLYICKEIIEAYAGTIQAIDPPDGTGACMRIVLSAAVTRAITLPEEES